MQDLALAPSAERRKQVRLIKRPDLVESAQKYEGRFCMVVKDPVSLKYFRFNHQEYFVFKRMDSKHTLEQIQKDFEIEFPPARLQLEDLESFARQLVTSGLVLHDSENTTRHLFERRAKERRKKTIGKFVNILYIKIPFFDPDRLLGFMYKFLWWIFTNTFFIASTMLMLSAAALVTFKFQVFWDKLPAYNEFFRYQTVLYMWLSLGVVKVIHEFGHGLSCKAYGGECHEMGALLMCFSPALYANVTDSWTLADKWKRIIISFAGIYVELIIASIATFVWWFTPHFPFVNNVALCLMVLCSVSTFVFNANPLMRFDGYYILADWLEVPNLRERANKYLTHQAQETFLGMEVPPEQYMAPWRKLLFITYAIASYVYRWVVTFGIIWFLYNWLKPYKLETISLLLAAGSLGSMFIMPMYKLFKSIRQRGRLPDMKRPRVIATGTLLAALLIGFLFVPLPVSRVRETGLIQMQDRSLERVYAADAGFLDRQYVEDGTFVNRNQLLATFSSPKMEQELTDWQAKVREFDERARIIGKLGAEARDPSSRQEYQAQLTEAQNKLATAVNQERRIRTRLDRLRELRAPREGYVMSPPKRDDVGRYMEKQEPIQPFCSIGDVQKVRVLVPVNTLDYQTLRDNLHKRKELEVSIHLPGRFDRVYRGRVVSLPETDTRDVPIGLTSRGGGPLAVRPSQDPSRNEPLAQTYVVTVEILDPDTTILSGTQANVKIHNEWKSGWWWVRRSIASALDWGIL